MGLWLIPGFCAFHYHWWTFLSVRTSLPAAGPTICFPVAYAEAYIRTVACAMQSWSFFSAVTAYTIYLCMGTGKLAPATPRRVFSWFLYSHHTCVAIGAAGYFLFILELLGVGPVVKAIFGDSTSVLLLWYGLYFGVLGRDTAEVAFSGLVRAPPPLPRHRVVLSCLCEQIGMCRRVQWPLAASWRSTPTFVPSATRS